MADWIRHDPIVVVRGQGSWLWDSHGNRYLDGNASIWTNLHGHRHPSVDRAIHRQLSRVAHCSSLGLANGPAADLARNLVQHANPQSLRNARGSQSAPLQKVFYSDDGSTAIEAALKMVHVFAQRVRGHRNPRFLTVDSAYHGDTLGAVSLGHLGLFHDAFRGLLFPTGKVMSPYCYRCPFNRASPQRVDARQSRNCQWECVDNVARQFESASKRRNPYAAFVVEPLVQGAAGMIGHPPGWLKRVSEIARAHEALLITDEVLSGFARASDPEEATGNPVQLLASHQEGVQPDLTALAKGLTGGYLPMAATLTTREVFDAFSGRYEDFKTFFHGHSYSGNPLGAAAAGASLELLSRPSCARARRRIAQSIKEASADLWRHPQVGDVRQIGMILAVELVRDWKTREPWPLKAKAGIRVCREMAKLGVLTRPIGNVVVIMPPYSTRPEDAARMIETLGRSIRRVFAP
ncbi:MAG: adenosylmethionine--8-amino-7-oxononanoate transaminase [Verrucomicrobia bacterium]|nr:adenosylmethionine--8-amino-7-oxononanoate transaminase [Verrucomicrobiota bacterium]